MLKKSTKKVENMYKIEVSFLYVGDYLDFSTVFTNVFFFFFESIEQDMVDN